MLLLQRGEAIGPVFPLRDGSTVVVGRDPDADLPIEDPAVEPLHCRIEVAPGGAATVEPAEVGVELSVDGAPIAERTPLPDGARVRLGASTITVRRAPGAAPGAPSPRPAACARCGRPIAPAWPVAQVGAAGYCPRCVDRRLEVPRHLDRYRILGKIGSTHHEVIYLAEEAPDGRRVALRLLRAERARDPGVARRFVLRGFAGLGLTHPAFLRHLDLGCHRGILFAAVELIPWVTLADLLEASSRLGLRGAMFVVLQVVEAAIHARRVGLRLGWPVLDRILVNEALGARIATFWPAPPLAARLAEAAAARFPDLAGAASATPAALACSPRDARYLHGVDPRSAPASAAAPADATDPSAPGRLLFQLVGAKPAAGATPERVATALLGLGGVDPARAPASVARALALLFDPTATAAPPSGDETGPLEVLQRELRGAYLALM